MSTENDSDPLNSNFFSLSNDFSSVDSFIYSSVPHFLLNECSKCVLCDSYFGIFHYKYICKSCGLPFCQYCGCVERMICDGCLALSSDDCNVSEYNGLVNWCKRRTKTYLDEIGSVQTSIDYFMSCLFLKEAEFHLTASIVLHNHISVLNKFNVTNDFIDSLVKHSPYCKCGSFPILLDIFAHLIRNGIIDYNPLDLDYLSTLLELSDKYVVRSAARVALVLSERDEFDPDQFFFINVSLNTKDKLTAAYILSALANISPIPMHYEIFKGKEQKNHFKNVNKIIETCFNIFDNNCLKSLATEYYSAVILCKISETPELAKDIAKYDFKNIIESLRTHYKNGIENQEMIISCFIGKVVFNVWKNSSILENADEVLSHLFSFLRQPIKEIMNVFVPFVLTDAFVSLQTIFMNIIMLISNNKTFEADIQSEEMNAIIERLKLERKTYIKKIPKSISQVELEKKEFEAKINDLKDQIKDKKENIESLRKMIAEMKNKESKLYNDYSSSEIAQNNLDNVYTSLEKVEFEIEKVEEELEKGNEKLKFLKEKLDEAKCNENKAKKCLYNVNKSIEQIKKELAAVEEEKENKENKINTKEEEIENLQNFVEKSVKESCDLETLIKGKNENIEIIKCEIEENKEKCKELENQRNEDRERFENYKNEIEEKKLKLETLENDETDAIYYKINEEYENKKKETENIKLNIEEKKENITKLEVTNKEKKALIHSYKEEIQKIEDEKEKEEKEYKQKVKEISKSIKEKKINKKLVALIDSFILSATPLTKETQDVQIDSLFT